MFNRKIIVITGQTASGKSDIALKLAKEINGVIINGDSRQIYKELTIGTAKPILQRAIGNISYIENIPHYLYSALSIEQRYTVYDYQKDVRSILKKLPKEKVPIIVGGTGLYIDSVFFNYDLQKNTSNDTYQSYTLEQLKELVGEKELSKLNSSDKENARRLIRILQKRNSKTDKVENEKLTKPVNGIYFVLDIPTEEINKKIERRVYKMFEQGLIEENRKLLKFRKQNLPALNTIGYQEFDGYFEKRKSIKQVKEEIINHTKQYAKRQRTWFKRNRNAILVKTYDEIEKKCKEFLLK